MNPLTTIESWFASRGWQPFDFQREAWQAYLGGASGLIHAATGTGKSYAAWMGALLEWLAEAPPTTKTAPPLRVLWVTPLRALAADTATALRAPLDDLALPWVLELRTGDSSSATRRRQRERLPTALITTPESLSLLLSYPAAKQQFADLRLVVVDEWHELLGSKRGVQTELALARLRHWRPGLRTWGLSATLGNLDVALAALVGIARDEPQRPQRSQSGDTTFYDTTSSVPSVLSVANNSASSPQLIRGLQPKQIQIESLLPASIERFPWAGHLGLRLLPAVLDVLEASQSALLFTNTRSQTEQWYQALLEARPAWAGELALHHSALDRATREWVEQALRAGRLRCVVCTSSLDLGVDFAPVDTVLQVGSPKGVARLVQRAGRSGHQPGAVSRVVCVPTHALELIEFAAARDALAAGELEGRAPITAPLDLLVQHIVTIALGGGFRANELWAEVRSSYAYRDLAAEAWEWALEFASRGGPALRSYPEYARLVEEDGVYQAASQAIARRHRLAIGTIIGEALIRVQYMRGGEIGLVEEGFVARLRPGDRFVLAGKTLEFVRVRDMVAWVRRGTGSDARLPRWSGSRLPLSGTLASRVRQLIADARNGELHSPELRAVAPLLRVQARWSHLPGQGELLVERLRTREGYHLFVYPFEGRLVHEGMAALLAYRLSRLRPITFTLAANDYGFELLAAEDSGVEVPGGPSLHELLAPAGLAEDLLNGLNAAEMARRQFREVARVAGLITQGYPGEKNIRQIQASSSLLFDVFTQYDPENLLLRQAEREVFERQLEGTRLAAALLRLQTTRLLLAAPPRPTPFAFPLLVDRLRATISSETLAERVRKMQLTLERAAGGS